MALKYAFKLIFLKCIFEFMVNSAPPTSNNVHGREKSFKDDKGNGTIIPWLRGAIVKDLTCISHGYLTEMDLL